MYSLVGYKIKCLQVVSFPNQFFASLVSFFYQVLSIPLPKTALQSTKTIKFLLTSAIGKKSQIMSETCVERSKLS